MPEVLKRLSLARQIDKILRKDSKVFLPLTHLVIFYIVIYDFEFLHAIVILGLCLGKIGFLILSLGGVSTYV